MIDLPWTGFLERALWGLEQAAGRLSEPETRARMEAAPDWWRKPVRSGPLRGIEIPEETAVSGALEALFEEIRADQQISGPTHGQEDLRHVHLVLEKRRPRDRAIGKKTKPTDIAIILAAEEHFDLRIEAKTLVEEADIRAEYLSDRGLLRFEDADNPYTDAPYGGMLAYIVSDDSAVWQDRIRRGLNAGIGAARIAQMSVGGRPRMTSTHSFPEVKDGVARTVTVNVLHLVAEIEAKPSRRLPATSEAKLAGA